VKYLVAALASSLLIPVPQVGNVSLIEAIWTLVGMAAVLVSLYSLPRVISDYVISRHEEAVNPPLTTARVLLARGHVRREVIRLAQGLIILSIGVVADLQPNPFQSITILGLVVTMGLVGLSALVVAQSILDRVQRRQAEELLDFPVDER
jgi:hypothetical protein